MDSGSPHRGPVADLVDPYATKDSAPEVLESLTAWLINHPGRWALFCDGEYGIDPNTLMTREGFEVSQRDRHTSLRRAYARVPHPEGESLARAISRSGAAGAVRVGDLPVLDKDTFNWTAEELEMACKAAKESLFPVRALRGTGGKK